MQRIIQFCEVVFQHELSESALSSLSLDSECCDIISLTSTVALALLSCLQHLPLLLTSVLREVCSGNCYSFPHQLFTQLFRPVAVWALPVPHPKLQELGFAVGQWLCWWQFWFDLGLLPHVFFLMSCCVSSTQAGPCFGVEMLPELPGEQHNLLNSQA